MGLLALGLSRPNLRAVKAGIIANRNDLSNMFDPRTGWTSTGWGFAEVNGYFPGYVGIRCTNDGSGASRSILQNAGVIQASGNKLVLRFWVENVSATTTNLIIQDYQSGTDAIETIHHSSLTWATDSVITVGSPSGGSSQTNSVTVLSNNGPNGGKVVLLEISAVSNDTSDTTRPIIYPTGLSTNTDAVVWHAVQYTQEAV